MEDSVPAEIAVLRQKLNNCPQPPELLARNLALVDRLERIAKSGGNYVTEFDSSSRYIDWIVNLPWVNRSNDILDINTASQMLNKNHYGLKEAKDRILEYLAVLKLNDSHRAPVMALIGLVGTGKTTLTYSIADAMGRKIERIPFGGIGDAIYLRGQSKAFSDAEPGAVIKAMRRCGTKNPVILLDEIDRVDENARAAIMGVLVELLDPKQNQAFIDHYIDYPFDLSEVLFVVTANNSTNISTAVLDRLELISMPSYSDEEKTNIGKDFVLPKAMTASGLKPEILSISPSVWPKVIRPLGYDGGIRTLERTINAMVRKIAFQITTGEAKQVTIDESNLQQYLP